MITFLIYDFIKHSLWCKQKREALDSFQQACIITHFFWKHFSLCKRSIHIKKNVNTCFVASRLKNVKKSWPLFASSRHFYLYYYSKVRWVCKREHQNTLHMGAVLAKWFWGKTGSGKPAWSYIVYFKTRIELTAGK